MRELLAAGRTPRLATLKTALERLSHSPRRAHREYGAAQRRLVDRLDLPAA